MGQRVKGENKHIGRNGIGEHAVEGILAKGVTHIHITK